MFKLKQWGVIEWLLNLMCMGMKYIMIMNKKAWCYTKTDNDFIEWVKCEKPPIDDVDFCLYVFQASDSISDAYCGHNVKQGYIKLKDAGIFREVEWISEIDEFLCLIDLCSKIQTKMYEVIIRLLILVIYLIKIIYGKW